MKWQDILRQLALTKPTKQKIKDLQTVIDQWYATHWRDDDSPKAEFRAAREN